MRGEGVVTLGHQGDNPREMSHSRQWRFCPEQYMEPAAAVRFTPTPRTWLRTCLPVYHLAVPRPDIHTHTVPSLFYQASSSVFAACLLLSLSTQLLTSPLSTVTTKPSELFLKVWTKRSDLHFFVVGGGFCGCTPAVCSLTA